MIMIVCLSIVVHYSFGGYHSRNGSLHVDAFLSNDYNNNKNIYNNNINNNNKIINNNINNINNNNGPPYSSISSLYHPSFQHSVSSSSSSSRQSLTMIRYDNSKSTSKSTLKSFFLTSNNGKDKNRNDNKNKNENHNQPNSRRLILKQGIINVPVLSLLASFTNTLPPIQPAHAFPIPSTQESKRIQLELCLVTILRVQYWAQRIGTSIQTSRRLTSSSSTSSSPSSSLLIDKTKSYYLEARLGAKALLTGRLGGGANSQVLTLRSLQLRSSLQDAQWWYQRQYTLYTKQPQKQQQKQNHNYNDYKTIQQQGKQTKMQLDSLSTSIIESLAALVEFDGLETTQDPSPRSSLTLSSYNDSKAYFVQRILLERIVVDCEQFVNLFGSKYADLDYLNNDGDYYSTAVLTAATTTTTTLLPKKCKEFVRTKYPTEVPISVNE
eukprot:CAMPEP_0184861860 /NCGR_PEP_ID=MMETSP0580-20130426/6449_1 /TAXON_ID=1118495 /ORGANISM="Dactyliosolen fragilissimus" /LENGTH=437 /DNA_ID=CAMNT_0027359507 /DNA_START=331 /DNA_END=1644 /DNA_ORIENTATION=+